MIDLPDGGGLEPPLPIPDAALDLAPGEDGRAPPDLAPGPLADRPVPDWASPLADLLRAQDLAAPIDGAVAPCPPEMVHLETFCVDRYEAHLVELRDGGVAPHSPFLTVGGRLVAARSQGGVMPQGYVSQVEAAAACRNAGKRLCSATEFSRACRGPDPTNYYPYGGQKRQAGFCNEGKGSSVARFFGNDPSKWTYGNFNDPRLNQWDGGLAPTGAYANCVSPDGVHDCVGNLHEWGSDPPDARNRGRFRGGFHGDAEINGKGCLYVTSAHEPTYHDYSTGFRCCRDSR